MVVNGRRKKAEDRSVWAVILKATLVKQYGPCAEKGEELQEEETVFRFSEKRFRIVRGNRKLRHLTQYKDPSL